MKTNEIITMTNISIATATFKDERLANATKRITAIYSDAAKYADSKNREIAKILSEVAEKKSYEADGFKSVADYAATIFGIARQSAYALANAGKVYNDKDAHPELKAMSPSKIAELANVEPTALKEALDTGKINRDTTQKDMREFATSISHKESKPVVLDQYIARPCIPVLSEELSDTMSLPRTINEWEDWFMDYVANETPHSIISPIEIIKLPKGKVNPDDKKATIERRLFVNRNFSIVVEFSKYVNHKDIKKPVRPNFTKEELLAMMEALEDEEVQDTSEDVEDTAE